MNGQRGSFDQFLDDERAVGILLTAVEHGDDPRVVEAYRLGLSLEALSRFGIVGEMGKQAFDRDEPAEEGVSASTPWPCHRCRSARSARSDQRSRGQVTKEVGIAGLARPKTVLLVVAGGGAEFP